MADESKIYVKAAPGDVITAEGWNGLQEEIYDDIRTASVEAAGAIQRVEQADDSDKLGGQTPDELLEDLIDRVLDEVRARQGYIKAYKVLKLDEPKIIVHGFGACPIVDVYQLDYFQVVCSEDDEIAPAWTTFYVYHTSEKKIKYPKEEGAYPRGTLEIEPKDGPAYKIPFARMLKKLDVAYGKKTSVEDLLNEFWKKLFEDPSDEFDDEQYCHSPWFHRCCRDQKSVRQLKEAGDWDDLWFSVRPRKTINYPVPSDANPGDLKHTPAPTQIQVSQYDLDSVGITLVAKPVYPAADLADVANEPPGLTGQFGDVLETELKVMVLLKC